MRFVLFCLIILLIGCSSQENITLDSSADSVEDTSSTEVSNIFTYTLSVSSTEDSLLLSSIATLEGNYAGLDIVFTNSIFTFKLLLPTIDSFGTWVGLCTSEGCIIEYKCPEGEFILTQNDFTDIVEISDNPIKPILCLINLKNTVEDTLFFEEFTINVKEFRVEDNKLYFKAGIEGKTTDSITINSNFNIKDFEMDQVFI